MASVLQMGRPRLRDAKWQRQGSGPVANAPGTALGLRRSEGSGKTVPCDPLANLNMAVHVDPGRVWCGVRGVAVRPVLLRHWGELPGSGRRWMWAERRLG